MSDVVNGPRFVGPAREGGVSHLVRSQLGWRSSCGKVVSQAIEFSADRVQQLVDCRACRKAARMPVPQPRLARELVPGDVLCDAQGVRLCAVFDVGIVEHKVRVWSSWSDQMLGVADVLSYADDAPVHVLV